MITFSISRSCFYLLDIFDSGVMRDRYVEILIYISAFILIAYFGIRYLLKFVETDAQESLQKRYNEIATSSSDIVFILDRELRFKYISPSYTKLLGFEFEDLNGKDYFQYIFPADQFFLRKMITLRIKNAYTTKPIQYRIKAKNGKYKYIETIGRNLFDNKEIQGYLVNAHDISEEMEKEKQLKESEERLRDLFNNAHDIICVLDENLNFQYLNNAFTKILGYKNEEALNKNIFDFIHPAYKAIHSKTYEEAFKKGLTKDDIQLHCISKNQELIVLDCNVTKSSHVNAPPSYRAICRDVTQMLKDIELIKFQSDILAQINEAVCVFNLENKIIFLNEIVTKKYNISLQEAFGKSISEVFKFHYLSGEDKRRIIKEIISTGKAEGEVFHYNEEKEMRTLEFSINKLLDSSGKFSGYSCIFRDITSRKVAIEELLKSQQKLSLHVQQTDIGFIEWNTDFKIVDWNPGAEGIFEYKKEEVLGMDGRIIIPEENMFDTNELWNKLLNKEGGYVSVTANITKSKKEIACEWHHTPLIDPKGKVIGVASVVQDVSQQKRAEQELLKAKELAELNTQMKSEFLSNMSHEIRTPLNGIIGFTELTLNSDLMKEQRENLEMVKYSADSLLAIIDDILDFSKIEAGKLQIEKVPFDLQKLFENLRSFFLFKLRENNIKIKSHIDPELKNCLILGDPMRIQQVLMNLVSNAIKFSEKGSISLSAADTISEEGKTQIIFTVKDTGIGIEPSKLEMIFNAFTQADGSITRRYGGTGLGLSITRQLVEMMGGKIWVESVVDVGSTFSFSLPCEKIQKEKTDVRTKSYNTSIPEEKNSHLKVLVAEYSLMNQKLIQRILTDLGYKSVIANNGAEALKKMESDDFDLVLMDVHMPVMDGFEATLRIRENEKKTGKYMPIIALTAMAMHADRERCIAGGMNDYISKPFSSFDIVQIINKVLEVNHSKSFSDQPKIA